MYQNRLRDLYTLPMKIDEQEIYLLDLRMQCTFLEERVKYEMESMPVQQRQLLEEYIAARDELEFHSVKRALRLKRGC